MIDHHDQERAPSITARSDHSRRHFFLSLNAIPLLWPNIETHKQSWETYGGLMMASGDSYAGATIRRAVSYEEQACEQYRSACLYHQQVLHCGAAMGLEKSMLLSAHALQRWGYTAVWLKHLSEEEQSSTPSSFRSMISRLLLEVAQQQQHVCITLNCLQRTYFAYCFRYALIPSLLEEDKEEEHQQ